MLVVQKGKCRISLTTLSHMMPVQGVRYNNTEVYFSKRNGVLVGKYTGAYIIGKDGNFHRFGEIKFTVGTIENYCLNCNYVLCEY